MVNPHEISSTEKLLNLIRDKGNGADDRPGFDASPPRSPLQTEGAPAASCRPKPGISGRKGLTVGIDIGQTDIKLVAVGAQADKTQKMVDWASFALEPGLAHDSARLGRVLKTAMSGFCARNGKTELWACISSANVETRALKIPKVPPKQMANAVLWAFRKEASLDEKTDIVDFHVIGEISEDNAPRLQVMASTAPKKEVDGLKRLFARSGFPLTGISIVPFAFQNLFRSGWLATGSEDVCALFVGKDSSRITIFSGDNLVLSRDIKTGMKSLVQTIEAGIESAREQMPLQMSDLGEGRDGEGANRHPAVADDQAEQLLVDFMDISSEKKSSKYPEKELLEMIRPALDRILRQVEMTFEHYYQRFSEQRVGKLFVSGPISGQPLVTRYFQDQLGLPVETIDPFDRSVRAPEVSTPDQARLRSDFIPAAGLALSRIPQTPNFLFTYKDKARKRIVRRFDNVVLAFFVLVMAAFGGLHQWLSHQHALEDKRIEALRSELAGFVPRLDQGLLRNLAGQTASMMKHLAAVSKRYEGMAVVNEIARLTPEKIRLVSLAADLGPPKQSKAKRRLVLDGIVTGDGKILDAVLAQYVIELGQSALFDSPTVDQQSHETIDGEDVLRFALTLELV